MEKEIIDVIAKALDLKFSEISLESTANEIVEWDSLGHLSLLQQLDIKYDNISEKAPELASVSTVREIVEAVKAHQ